MSLDAEEHDRRVQAELRNGERLVWSGQPNPACYARTARMIVLFAIPWTAFAVFWVGATAALLWFSGDPEKADGIVGTIFLLFPLFGIPFILIGLGMFTAPFWMRRQARRTSYALTEKRAIV